MSKEESYFLKMFNILLFLSCVFMSGAVIILEGSCPTYDIIDKSKMAQFFGRPWYVSQQYPTTKDDGSTTTLSCIKFFTNDSIPYLDHYLFLKDNFVVKNNTANYERNYAVGRMVHKQHFKISLQFYYDPLIIERNCLNFGNRASQETIFWEKGNEIIFDFLYLDDKYAVLYSCEDNNGTHSNHAAYILSSDYQLSNLQIEETKHLFNKYKLDYDSLQDVTQSCECRLLEHMCLDKCIMIVKDDFLKE